MTVAVKNVPESGTTNPLDRLAVASVVGVVYVVASLWAVFQGVPRLWDVVWPEAPAVGVAVKVLVMLAVAAGLAYAGTKLYLSAHQPGLCAGVFFGLVGLLLFAEVTAGVGLIFERNSSPASVGVPAMVVVGAALLAGFVYLLSRPDFDSWLVTTEEQGWFAATSYKRTQGTRVRRATLLGIVLVIGCGIYTMLSHRTLANDASWVIPVPYAGLVIPLLPHVGLTVPLLLAALAFWFGWRAVNYPVFADFLIATEAEMNKVSWTTRRRLIQDTVVVLATVFLLTVFLFVVDMAWAWGLTRIGVLQQAAPGTQQTTVQEPSY